MWLESKLTKAVCSQLKDIRLCTLAVEHADSKLSVGWRVTLRVINLIRRWTFMPVLLVAIPFTVMFQGGDALNV